MAKKRYIDTKFWSDNYITELDPLERYLYLYFLSNEHTNLCGIYEIPLRIMAFEAGLDTQVLKNMLDRFERDGKVVYRNGWIFIRNFIKNQSLNPSVLEGIQRELEEAPQELKDLLDTDSIQPPPREGTGKLSKVRLSKVKSSKERTPSEKAREFFESKEKQEEVIISICEKGFNPQIVRNEITKFISYWTELNKSGTQQKWQMQKTFEIGRRLATWFSNYNEFSKNKTFKKIIPQVVV